MPDRLDIPLLPLLLLVLVDLLVKVVSLGLVPERRRPSAATAWLLVVFFVPLLGLVAYALLGRRGPRRRRPPVQAEAQAGMIVLHHNVYPPLPDALTGPDWLRDLLGRNARLGYLDPVAGSRVELYADDRAATAAMVDAVAAAERFVHLECSVLAGDQSAEAVVAALAAAARRGVAVRLAHDDRASVRGAGSAALLARLEGTGIERPVAPARRHPRRNLLVVDGRVAFGGASLLGPGVGLVFGVHGPLAHSLSVVFAADWHLEGRPPLPPELFALPPALPDGAVGQVVASGSGSSSENQLTMITTLVYGARRRLSLTGPLLTPDEALLLALATAARRGVAVEVFVGAESDDVVGRRARQSGYAALLEAGVRIHRQPGRFTDRQLSVDDTVAVIGSSGGDAAAVSVLLLGADVVGRLRVVEDGYRTASTEITPATWRKRTLASRCLDNALGGLYPLR